MSLVCGRMSVHRRDLDYETGFAAELIPREVWRVRHPSGYERGLPAGGLVSYPFLRHICEFTKRVCRPCCQPRSGPLIPHSSAYAWRRPRPPAILQVPPPTEMQYDFFMGLAAISAMPVVAAVVLFCVPLAAQSRPPEANPKRLIEKADRLAWLYNWYLAGPIYAEAEMQFEHAGDSRNVLYAKIGRLRSEWESMSFPEVSEYLATALESPVVQNDPQLRLWILDAKGTVDLEVNVASARQVYEEARKSPENSVTRHGRLGRLVNWASSPFWTVELATRCNC